MKLMMIIGSVREGRQADVVSRWAQSVIATQNNLELDIVDLKELNLPFFHESVSPSDNNGTYETPYGQAWADHVASADAFLFLVAEYNHGPTAVLKNAIDWVYQGWQHKPVGFISYGGVVGGARAVEQLRQITLHVGLHPLPLAVHIPRISNAFDEFGKPTFDGLNKNLESLIMEIKQLHQKLRV